MFGTIINVVTVILGGLLGILLKKGIKSEIMENVMKAEGVAVLIIGTNGVLTNMLSVGADGKISENALLRMGQRRDHGFAGHLCSSKENPCCP